MSMPSPGPVTRDLLETFDEVCSRILARLDGLTDAEYLWEPVTPCMTVRAGADGVFRADPRPTGDPRPAPFTTIAWRTWHIGADCLRGYGRFFGDRQQGDDERHRWPGTAAEGVRAMVGDWTRFRSRVGSLGDDRLLEPMGSRAGVYGHELPAAGPARPGRGRPPRCRTRRPARPAPPRLHRGTRAGGDVAAASPRRPEAPTPRRPGDCRASGARPAAGRFSAPAGRGSRRCAAGPV